MTLLKVFDSNSLFLGPTATCASIYPQTESDSALILDINDDFINSFLTKFFTLLRLSYRNFW